MQVLDLGCGRATSSIFFAKEFGAAVWAADLWVKPTENRQRIAQAGLSDRVFAVFAEAHDLPFAEESLAYMARITRDKKRSLFRTMGKDDLSANGRFTGSMCCT